jgi:hypothetical protein
MTFGTKIQLTLPAELHFQRELLTSSRTIWLRLSRTVSDASLPMVLEKIQLRAKRKGQL